MCSAADDPTTYDAPASYAGELFCVECGSSARIRQAAPTLDARYPLVRCRRGHKAVGTRDVVLAARARAAWDERTTRPASTAQ